MRQTDYGGAPQHPRAALSVLGAGLAQAGRTGFVEAKRKPWPKTAPLLIEDHRRRRKR